MLAYTAVLWIIVVSKTIYFTLGKEKTQEQEEDDPY